MSSLLKQRTYRHGWPVACCLALVLGMLTLVSCQSSVERARHDMEPAYRSAKLLREQLKAGATLAEFNRLRANLATELGIISDRMKASPRAARLLQPYFSAYSSALDAYSLVGDVWQYRSAMDTCEGPRYEYTRAQFADASLREQIDMIKANAAWMGRAWKCTKIFQKASEALTQRSEQLNTHCGSAVEFHFDCIVKNADGKLTAADKVLMQR